MFEYLFHSFFVTQVVGLFLVILAAILLIRTKYYRHLLESTVLPSGAILVGASFGMIVGLFLVIIHNIWVLDPRVIVTIAYWFIFIKSILWIAIPEKALAWSKKLYSGIGYSIALFILALLGVFLMTKGFYIYM